MQKIGITISVNNERTNSLLGDYVKAIESIGAIPVLIPYLNDDTVLEALVGMCDGVLFSGGTDICPQLYGESTLDACGEISPLRDEIELRVLNIAVKAKKPIMAICRGAQLINVALGGTLYQDIPTQAPTQISHRQKEPRYSHSHDIIIDTSSPLFELLGKETIKGNSFHHQATKELGAGLVPMASAPDGIIEAFYLDSDVYLRAYQWHPERLCESDENHKKLFSDFLKACKGE